jgi:hypothetical protein
VPAGIVTWFDPGGAFVLPDWTTAASEHGGTTIVSAECCFAISTVLTPGLCNAVDTASLLELDELEPQPATPSASAATPTNARLFLVPAVIVPPVAVSSALPDSRVRVNPAQDLDAL